jgi:secreted trypsin-like serine protease
MIRILIFFAVASLSQVDGDFTNNFTTVVGWDAIDIKQAPYQASIIYQNAYVCAGTIISKSYIVTAAQCVDQPGTYKVRVGSNWPDRQGIVMNVAKVTTHPKYNRDLQDYDVALLQLQTPIRQFVATIKSIALPAANQKPVPGTSVQVIDWSMVSTTMSLMKAQNYLMSQSLCEYFYGPSRLTSRLLCIDNTRDRANCKGTSHFPPFTQFLKAFFYKGIQGGEAGAPVIYSEEEFKLFGIISWDPGCKCGQPAIYGVTNYVFNPEIRQWILDSAGV